MRAIKSKRVITAEKKGSFLGLFKKKDKSEPTTSTMLRSGGYYPPGMSVRVCDPIEQKGLQTLPQHHRISNPSHPHLNTSG